MKVRIGTDIRGQAITIDRSSSARIALLRRVAVGKTTTCRLLARCWIIHEGVGCMVLTNRPYGCADLPWSAVTMLALTDAAPLRRDDQLVVVDEGDLVNAEPIESVLAGRHHAVIITSYRPAVSAVIAANTTEQFTEVYSLHRSAGLSLTPIQGRPDWQARST
jgi:hypothetical protein